MVKRESIGWVIVEAEDEFDARIKVVEMDDIDIEDKVYYWDTDGPVEVTDNIDEVR